MKDGKGTDREEGFGNDSAKEVELLEAESVEVGAGKDESAAAVLLDSLSELDGRGGDFANSGGNGVGGIDGGAVVTGIVIGVGVRVGVDGLEEAGRVGVAERGRERE